MERNKRYQQDLVSKVEEICSRDNAVQVVGEEFYREFTCLTDDQLRTIIGRVVLTTYETINRNVLSGDWADEEDIYFHVMMFLELIAEGKVAFSRGEDKSIKLCFFKPAGSPPTDYEWSLIQNKIENARPIISEVILESLNG